MNNYLIPANSKKSILYFGLFNKFDLILFGSGIGATLLMMTLLPTGGSWLRIGIIVAPAVITGLLVFPVPNYHNVLSLLRSVWNFFTTRQRFIWKGWCVRDEFKEEEENIKK
jgi:hypothetical protein